MSILPPLSAPPLTQARLVELLHSHVASGAYPHLLRWLIWFPLLSAEELTRLEQARWGELGQSRSPQWVAAQLKELEDLHLVTHLLINEPGWPPHQHRLHLTDAGLSLFAAQAKPPLSVPRLAQAYAVERADLLARLAHISTHLLLAEFSTRLAAEGATSGYTLTCYQQPWKQVDTLLGRRRTLTCDAALLLADLAGREHAFYVLVDTEERVPFEDDLKRAPLRRLLALRQGFHLRREPMPRLLIVTTTARLHRWGALLDGLSTRQATAPLLGAMTTRDRLQSGVHGPIWWPFEEVTHWMHGDAPLDLPVPSTPLSRLLGEPASSALIERFSQRRSFAHLLTERTRGPLRPTARLLAAHVGKSLTHERATLRADTLADALAGTPSEQREALALLTLRLSAMQKDLLTWLAHQPLLTIRQLAALHHPTSDGIRGVREQLMDLLRLGLVVPFFWSKAPERHARERYLLSESALRFIALREGKPVASSLLPDKYKKKGGSPSLSIQLGTKGLFAKMEHTHGLYECMVQLVRQVQREGMQCIAWKSEYEAVRAYRHPITSVTMPIRPDAELIVLEPARTVPSSILLEYDRATVNAREHEAKYLSYADYQEYTGRPLPPLLVVTQHERAAERIRAAIHEVAPHLHIALVLEHTLQQEGVFDLVSLLRQRG